MSHERAGCGPHSGRINVLAAGHGKISVAAGACWQLTCTRKHARDRIAGTAPLHDRSSPVWFLPVLAARSGRRGQRPGTWTSSAPLPVGQVTRKIRWPTRNWFRRLRNRGGVAAAARHRCCPPGGCPDRGRRPFAARCRRDQFVSGSVGASGRVLAIPDVTIPRPFAGTRLGYPPADGVCGS